MSYVLDVRELVHKLPFHHFTPYHLKRSCIGIMVTYSLPGLVAAAISAFYYFSYTLQNKLIFENTNANEQRTRALITIGVICALAPAALTALIEGFSGATKNSGTIEEWALDAQSGLASYGAPLMAMDDALVMLSVEATEKTDVAAQATVTSALATLKTVLINHGASSELIEEIEFFKWAKAIKVTSIVTGSTIATTLTLLLLSAFLPIYAQRRPAATWWRAGARWMSPDHFLRSFPMWTLIYSFIASALFWPLSVIGAEMCYAYDLMVEYQLPDSAQFYFLCPKFGYELGDTLATLEADKSSLEAALTPVKALGAAYKTTGYVRNLFAAEASFDVQYSRITEGFGDCQPMSDTIELTIHQLCDQVIIALQMFTVLIFGLTCLLAYGQLHHWFGSDVAKELVGDEESSLFSKLTGDSKLEVKSKFGAVELSQEEIEARAAKKRAKKESRRTWKRGQGESVTPGGDDSSPTSSDVDTTGENTAMHTREGSPTRLSHVANANTAGDVTEGAEIQMTDFLNEDDALESTRSAEFEAQEPLLAEFRDANFGEQPQRRR